jgi:hypothetical protein
MDWHQKIFPGISLVIVSLAAIFIGTSLYQFSQISTYLQSEPDADVQPIINKVLKLDQQTIDNSADAGEWIPHWAGLLVLESASMKKRHAVAGCRRGRTKSTHRMYSAISPGSDDFGA